VKPLDAFRYLKDHDLPLILSFPLREEKDRFITGKGTCYVEEIHGSSRVTFWKFSPSRLLISLRDAHTIYATFEIKGDTYGCTLTDILVEGYRMISSIPVSLKPFLRRFLRVEPSVKAPVLVYLKPSHRGTVSFLVRDISEQGIGFHSPSILELEETLLCGIGLPIEGRLFILSKASIIHRTEFEQRRTEGGMRRSHVDGVSYGLELFAGPEDTNKIRIYVMQREIEIRNKIQEQW
jgi:hypothetical protein